MTTKPHPAAVRVAKEIGMLLDSKKLVNMNNAEIASWLDTTLGLTKMAEALKRIQTDFNTTGQSTSNYSDGEYTQDYTTRRELIEKSLATLERPAR